MRACPAAALHFRTTAITPRGHESKPHRMNSKSTQTSTLNISDFKPGIWEQEQLDFQSRPHAIKLAARPGYGRYTNHQQQCAYAKCYRCQPPLTSLRGATATRFTTTMMMFFSLDDFKTILRNVNTLSFALLHRSTLWSTHRGV